MHTLFAENYTAHAERLRETIHRTRALRTALTARRLDQSLRGAVPWDIAAMSRSELEAALVVRWDGGEYVAAQGVVRDFVTELEASARQFFAPSTEAATKARQRAGHGGYSGNLLSGWVKQGETVVFTQEKRRIRAILLNSDSYGDIADQFNDAGFVTTTGRLWNKDTARDWCQNAFLAGYAKEVIGKDKRGELVYHIATAEPLLTLDEWTQVNAAFLVKAKLRIRFAAFHSNADEAAWRRVERGY